MAFLLLPVTISFVMNGLILVSICHQGFYMFRYQSLSELVIMETISINLSMSERLTMELFEWRFSDSPKCIRRSATGCPGGGSIPFSKVLSKMFSRSHSNGLEATWEAIISSVLHGNCLCVNFCGSFALTVVVRLVNLQSKCRYSSTSPRTKYCIPTIM